MYDKGYNVCELLYNKLLWRVSSNVYKFHFTEQ